MFTLFPRDSRVCQCMRSNHPTSTVTLSIIRNPLVHYAAEFRESGQKNRLAPYLNIDRRRRSRAGGGVPGSRSELTELNYRPGPGPQSLQGRTVA